MLHEMFQKNASKFARLMKYENPNTTVKFICFSPDKSPGSVSTFPKYMANFEAFHWNISSSIKTSHF